MNKLSVDVEKIVKETLRKVAPDVVKERAATKRIFNEAFVAEPKTFKQLTDSVSQKTKDEHYNLYKGYLESFNKISAGLDAVDREDANPRHSKFRTLKVDESYNLNSVWFHELYFSNCFDPNSEVYMDSIPYIRLQRDFGSFEDWQHDFIACAMSANEGWAVTGYHMFLKKFVNTFVDLHSQNVMAGLYPVIVLDCWSHSFYKDFPNDRKSYVLAQMKELNWTIISERFEKVEKVAMALR